jgi:hypothetical protein
MDDSILRRFFLEPSCPRQRQYEAIRAVVIGGCSQKDAAQRYGYSYQAFRQLLCEFRHSFTEDDPPPFSTDLAPVAHAADQRRARLSPSSLLRRPCRRSPTRNN